MSRRELLRFAVLTSGTLFLGTALLGLLLMGIQLWLLTVALELYLGGHGRQVCQLGLASGLIFLGGLLTLRLLGRRRPPRPLA